MSRAADVLVVGYGYAGAMAAIAAHDAGARVLLVEKRRDAGGISICSAGGVRCAENAGDALAYLEATNAGTTPRAVLAALAEGMVAAPAIVAALAEKAGATASVRPAPGNYPFPGWRGFGFVNIDAVENFDPARDCPNVRGAAAGARLFETLRRNVVARRIGTLFAAPAERLLMENDRVGGIVVAGEKIRAGAVVLASGGFEGDAALQRQFWPMQDVLSAAIRTNTGDGLRMAQAAGAALWHMWHYHGSYGFRHPDAAYPFGVRLKRLPDWTPGVAPREDVTMSWILVDRAGRRFMNEYEPYMQDTGHRALETMDFARMTPAHRPALLIVDAPGRALYPLSAPTWHDDDTAARFSATTPRAMDDSILRGFPALDDLAAAFGCDAAALKDTIANWNAALAAGADDPLGRLAASRAPVATPPFYAAEVWPIVSNTQGGPAHDERQRVLDAFGAPIAGLYEAGEIGSVFGHIYMSGGNLAECIVGGGIAGREAASCAKGETA